MKCLCALNQSLGCTFSQRMPDILQHTPTPLGEKKKPLSRLGLCDPMDCSPPGSSVHGILQARKLEWAAIPFPRGSSQTRDQPWVSLIAGRFFTL